MGRTARRRTRTRSHQECDPELKPPCHTVFEDPYEEFVAGSDSNGYVYNGWTGCDSVDQRTCQLTVSTSTTVTAAFRDAQAPTVPAPTPSSGVQRGSITIATSPSDNSGVIDRVEFRVRGVLVGSDTTAPYSTSFDTSTVSDGAATLRATAFDGSGNATFSESTVTFDNTAPDTSITGGPTGTTNDTDASFDLGSTEGSPTFRCEIDGFNLSPCSTPLNFTGVPEGTHTLTVWASDAAGNEDASAATRTWTVAAYTAAGRTTTATASRTWRWVCPTRTSARWRTPGLINVQYGSAGGISAAGAQAITQSTPDVAGFVNGGERFGAALASGDFNSDGYDDLAVGAPGDAASVPNAGSVTVLYGSPSGLTGTGSRLFTQDSAQMQDVGESGDGFGSALAVGDFGGSSDLDLAIGVPGENGGTGAVAGLVGSPSGLTADGNPFLTQSSLGTNPSEAGDHFGAALAAGDFGKDAHDDLAIGVPGEDTGSRTDAGAINVVYGSPSADFVTGNLFLAQSSSGVPGNDEDDDALGAALAAGDVTGDGHADVVAGEPGKDVSGLDAAGQVLVLPGSDTGVTITGSHVRNQDTSGVLDDAETDDRFGAALAVADFGGTAKQDVAIGTPGESVGGDAGAGQVSVLYGSAGGVSVNGDQILNQDRPGVADTSEPGDHFGATLRAAQFGNGTGADLVAGIPDEDVGSVVDAGAVHLLYSDGSVLSATGNQVFHQTSTGIPDSSEVGDHFGAGL